MGEKIATKDYAFVRQKLMERQEIALLDVREEAPHAEGHPLFAANFPYALIELNAYRLLPNRAVPIVTIDNGEGFAQAAAVRLKSLGYLDVSIFEGGIKAWKEAGGELFIDVNVPSKAFGEMMEASCHTPSYSAQEVKQMIEGDKDVLVVDVRRFDEYHTMCIPSAISVPGAELVARVPDLVASPETQIIVNCAGRTRGLIGTQSLINAGIPNPIGALRNGTIGWTLAGESLQVGQSRKFGKTCPQSLKMSAIKARQVADNCDVKRLKKNQFRESFNTQNSSIYYFDVRSREEYLAGHPAGFHSIPGGQLVQETEMHVPVRGARIVLADDDGVRANMTASWLAQMAWEVYVVDDFTPADFSEKGCVQAELPQVELPDEPEINTITAETLSDWINSSSEVVVVDVSKYQSYKKAHIPGAWYLLRSQLEISVSKLPRAARYVLTYDDDSLAKFVAPELQSNVDAPVYVLRGGNTEWVNSGYGMEAENEKLASERIDRYQRPYEGTQVSSDAMQAYLDWEFGLIEQMERDGSHHFQPLTSMVDR